MGNEKQEVSWALLVRPKINQDEQGNKVAPLQLNKGFGDGNVELRPVEIGDVVRIWNKDGLLIGTYIVGDYEK